MSLANEVLIVLFGDIGQKGRCLPIAAVVANPLGIGSADLARLVLEEPNVVGNPFDQVSRIVPATVVLQNVDRLVHHGSDILGMAHEIIDRAADVAAAGPGHPVIVLVQPHGNHVPRLEPIATFRYPVEFIVDVADVLTGLCVEAK